MKNFYQLTPEEKIPLLKEYMNYWIEEYQTEPKTIGDYTVHVNNQICLLPFDKWYLYKYSQFVNWARTVSFYIRKTVDE